MATNATNAVVIQTTTTMFVQADPSTFLAIVQKLTGAPTDPPAAFRLQERRSSKKLEVELEAGERGVGREMVSPVSTLDFLTGESPCEEEEKAIAEKRFYLHPNPIRTPRGSDPPHLLPLFPLSSSSSPSPSPSSSNCMNRNHYVSS
ncbi:VQ motif-containing protein 11-like [Cucurbita maxima]|uniref:VQ motif-containing protein 11-like n=1 Tax=Cucurbita maxima TaxID=3661 RepID=A0A6J1JSD9_CUCMA|nr:VQ motif-containing protein 11-like [Cucurbita maxima]